MMIMGREESCWEGSRSCGYQVRPLQPQDDSLHPFSGGGAGESNNSLKLSGISQVRARRGLPS